MLLHLPIAILTALAPIPISDTVPKFDIAKECHFEGGSSQIFDRCSQDEADALQRLHEEWPQFTSANRSSCLAEATDAGLASYVEFLICLEMARDVDKMETNPDVARGAESKPAAPPEASVVDKHE